VLDTGQGGGLGSISSYIITLSVVTVIGFVVFVVWN
jgi:hypothetical protein